MDVTKFVFDYRESAFLVGDYSTYRAQLSRRLLVVRKKLGRATGKNAKFQAKQPVTADEVKKDIEFLHLLLLTSERAWAHAMSMKASHSEDSADKTITGSTRSHILSRLHKAGHYAQMVVDLLADQSASGASDIDLLEAKGYAYLLAGAEQFEKQAEGARSNDTSSERWLPCLKNYSAARIIYNSLLKATKKDLFKEVLASTTDPSLRYAAYQHRIPRTVGVPEVAKKFFPDDQPQLAKSLEAIDSSAFQVEEASASSTKITWRNRTANIVDAAIGLALAQVDASSAQLAQSLESSNTPKDKANAYDDVLIASQDAADATRRAIDELKKEGVGEEDARVQDLRVTSLAVNYDLIAWRVGRYRILIGSDDGLTFSANLPHKSRRPRKDGKEWTPREEPTGRKLARLRERVALYDAILQSINSIKELKGAVGDSDFMAELEGQRAYFQALKCLNLSHSHAFLSAPRQALALCNRAQSLASQAASAPRPAEEGSDAPKLTVSDQQAQKLKQNLGNLTSHYRGLVALSQLSSNSEVASQSHLTNAAPVVERLNEYPSSGKVDLSNLVTWPPKLKPVPVKPMFLDVAWNYVEYPGRSKAQEATAPEKTQAEETKVEEVKPAKKGWFSFGR
ncbi:hypothetical protein DM02DRAFT_436782 [Periconia macrospinosa]|uniref:Signal recognition particle subunit SRP68 n=1 Tax=Periconia macrospinosa TaxID=97972 RepID=A0A2V1DM85_9PLEO|nr:hypothetical protein DM02DRAFT_436782 [Periconia macrospinosa]